MKSAFADRAKIPQTETEITLMTANGQARAKLSKADKVMLGKLAAANIPVAIQKADDKSYGNGVDGLLGMVSCRGSRSRWSADPSRLAPAARKSSSGPALACLAFGRQPRSLPAGRLVHAKALNSEPER